MKRERGWKRERTTQGRARTRVDKAKRQRRSEERGVRQRTHKKEEENIEGNSIT